MAPSAYQARRGDQTPIAHTPEQPIIAVRLEVMPTMSTEEQKMLERFQRLHPPHIDGDASQDAQNFVDRCHQMLHNFSLVESNGVDFTTFQLRGAAKRWW